MNRAAFPAASNGRACLPLRQMLADLHAGRRTSTAIVNVALDAAEASQREINAFSTVTRELALKAASESDKRYRNGTPRPLEGLPVSVKDLIDTEGIETSYGSAAYVGHFPAQDAEIVSTLRASGAVIIGKTTTHEFAWGVTTASTKFGDTLNPHDESRIPGGSSGGAAASIGYGVVAAGLGTDTGGSVRIPASLCGVVGFKPTCGRLSTKGIFPLAGTLDHPGILGKTVDDVQVLGKAFGFSADYTGAEPDTRIGVVRSVGLVPLEPLIDLAFSNSVDQLSRFFNVSEADPMTLFNGMFSVFAGIVLVEGGINHFSRSDPDFINTSYSRETLSRLEISKQMTVGDYATNLSARWDFIAQLEHLMRRFRFLVLPSTPCVAPKRGQETVTIGDWSGSVREALMSYTAPFNIAGFPAISVPMTNEKLVLPAGLQIVGRRGDDDALLAIAQKVEEVMKDDSLRQAFVHPRRQEQDASVTR